MSVESRWVFLRGLVRESAHWDDFPQRFAKAIPGSEVYPLDLPGNGVHWRQDSPLSLNETMEQVRAAFWAQTDRDRPIHLFAISLGAMVAIEWISRHPAEIAGAVLINTSLRGISPVHRRLCWRSWPLLARIASTGDVAARECLILRLTACNPQVLEDAALLQTRLDAYRRHPVRGINVLRQLWAAARYRPSTARPNVPLLLLNSAGDRLVDPSCTERLSRLWNTDRKTHPWAGHDLPLDDPDWTIAAVSNWLAARAFPVEGD